MTFKKTNDNGKVIPQPYGNYSISTKSGKFSKSVDLSLNSPTVVSTNFDVDSSNNIVNRTVTIAPKVGPSKLEYCGSLSTLCCSPYPDCVNPASTKFKSPQCCDPVYGDVIPNIFDLDISFNQVTYQLQSEDTVAVSSKLPKYLNYIDNSLNLIINGMGTIYDNSNSNIGTVGTDIKDANNKKSFAIKITNPVNTYYNIKSIIITFVVPLPTTDKASSEAAELVTNTNKSLANLTANPNTDISQFSIK